MQFRLLLLIEYFQVQSQSHFYVVHILIYRRVLYNILKISILRI